MKQHRPGLIAAIVATVVLAPFATAFLPGWSDYILSALEFVSEVIILLTVLSSPASLRSRALPFAFSMAALITADTFYSLRILKVLTIPLNSPLNIFVECCYGVFMVSMLVAVVQVFGGLKSFWSKWFWNVLLFAGFAFLNIKFIIIPYCQQSHPVILRFNTIAYGLASSAIMATTLLYAVRTMERYSHWFLQLIIMFIIADFGIRYQAVQVNITYFSWAEPGWCSAFVGLAWLCVYDRKLSFLEPRGKFAPFVSVRALLTLAICGANILFLFASLFFGIQAIKTGADLSSIFFLLYFFWFVSNEFSIWLARDFQTILPYMFQSTKHLSPDGTLNLRLERVRTKTSIYEINQVLESYNGLVEQENKLIDLSRQIVRDKALIEIASQVSHDIRSPLSALNMISVTAKGLDEERRGLMRNAVTRINDIANDLLQRYKTLQASNLKEARLIAIEIEQIISEKRLQMGGRTSIQIGFKTLGVKRAFVEMDTKEFKRVISNLINNSVEAFFDGKGNSIEIIVEDFDQRTIKVTVKDNGPGISADVLARLGASERVTTKETGFGLGLSHARKAIESLGGKLHICTSRGEGTAIEIILLKAPVPDWFCEKLVVEPTSKLVILDDDVSIHAVWRARLNRDGIPSICFTKGSELNKWYHEANAKNENLIFLVDFELMLQPQSGLDLVEALGIANKTILVTSRFDEPSVRERCLRLKIKIFPKALIEVFSLELKPLSGASGHFLIK